MASMTDVIFLLLIFFMVTSTFVFPTALELQLPESSQQTALKPSTRLFLYPEGKIIAQQGDESPVEVTMENLEGFLTQMRDGTAEGEEFTVAVFADETVLYREIARVLDIGARRGLKMVLATRPAPSDTTTTPSEP